MKKIHKFILLALIVLLPTIAFATSETTVKNDYYTNIVKAKKIYDYASILSDKTEQDLQNVAQDIYDQYKMDFVIMTTDLEIKESTYQLAQGFYYQGEFGYENTSDGIILVIDVFHREHYLLALGKASKVLTENKIESIQSKIDKDMRLGNYDEAVNLYAKQVKKQYFYHNYGPPLLWVSVVMVAVAIAYFEVQREKRKLKLVSDSLDASYYYDDKHIDFKNETLINVRETIENGTHTTSRKISNHSKNSVGKGRKF